MPQASQLPLFKTTHWVFWGGVQIFCFVHTCTQAAIRCLFICLVKRCCCFQPAGILELNWFGLGVFSTGNSAFQKIKWIVLVWWGKGSSTSHTALVYFYCHFLLTIVILLGNETLSIRDSGLIYTWSAAAALGSLFPVFTSKYSAAAAPRTGTDGSWSCS